MTILALSLITAAVLLLAAGYLIGRLNARQIDEDQAEAGPDVQVKGGTSIVGRINLVAQYA